MSKRFLLALMMWLGFVVMEAVSITAADPPVNSVNFLKDGVADPEAKQMESQRIRIIQLQRANAEECAVILRNLYGTVSSQSRILFEPRANVVIISSADEHAILRMQELLKTLDELSPKDVDATKSEAQFDASVPGNAATPAGLRAESSPRFWNDLTNPKAQELAVELSQREANSVALAQQIRVKLQASGKPDEVESQTRELKVTLRDSLAVKFQLEQLQVDALEARLQQLKNQIVRRSQSVERIVDRRARELIEGETSKWSWEASGTRADLSGGDSADHPESSSNESKKVVDQPLSAGTAHSALLSAGISSGVIDQQDATFVGKLIPPSAFLVFVKELSSAHEALMFTKGELAIAKAELAKSQRAPHDVDRPLLEAKTQRLANLVESQTRRMTALREEYDQVLKLLDFDLNAAQQELEALEKQLTGLNEMSDVVARRVIREAENEVRRARVKYERAKLIRDLFLSLKARFLGQALSQSEEK